MKSLVKKLIITVGLLGLARNIKKILLGPSAGIVGENNIITNKGILKKITYDIVGSDNQIIIMPGATLYNIMFYIRGNNHKIIIGENCYYKGGSIWIEDHSCELTIGRNTFIESAHLAITEPNRKITIGENCMFSYEIELRTGDSHSIIDNDTKKRINIAKDITVENRVWIGAHSIILKGVKIGSNSIIGIRSVVTKSVPNNSIAAGAPAKVIKNNIDWLPERIY